MFPEADPSPERKPDQTVDPAHVNPPQILSPKLQKHRLAQLLGDLKNGTTASTKLIAAYELLNLGEKGVVKARKVIAIAAKSSTEVREVLWRLVESWSYTHKLPIGIIKRQILLAQNVAHTKSVALASNKNEADPTKERTAELELEQYKATNQRMLRTLLALRGQKALHWLEGIAIGAIFHKNKLAAFSGLCELANRSNGFTKSTSIYALDCINQTLFSSNFESNQRRLEDLITVGAPLIKVLLEPSSLRSVRECDKISELGNLLNKLLARSYPMFKELLSYVSELKPNAENFELIDLALRACQGICDRRLFPLALLGLETGKPIIIDKALEVLKCNKKSLNSSDLTKLASLWCNGLVSGIGLDVLKLIQDRGRMSPHLETMLVDRLTFEKSLDINKKILSILRDLGGARAMGDLIALTKMPEVLQLHDEINDVITSIRQNLEN